MPMSNEEKLNLVDNGQRVTAGNYLILIANQL